jgi:hypothetical protein
MLLITLILDYFGFIYSELSWEGDQMSQSYDSSHGEVTTF